MQNTRHHFAQFVKFTKIPFLIYFPQNFYLNFCKTPYSFKHEVTPPQVLTKISKNALSLIFCHFLLHIYILVSEISWNRQITKEIVVYIFILITSNTENE